MSVSKKDEKKSVFRLQQFNRFNKIVYKKKKTKNDLNIKSTTRY
jgi:hypothetical protein